MQIDILVVVRYFSMAARGVGAMSLISLWLSRLTAKLRLSPRWFYAGRMTPDACKMHP
jgi:hypothetical protein